MDERYDGNPIKTMYYQWEDSYSCDLHKHIFVALKFEEQTEPKWKATLMI